MTKATLTLRIRARKISPELFRSCDLPVYLWADRNGRYWVGRKRFSVWKPMPADVAGDAWDQCQAIYEVEWGAIDPRTENVAARRLRRGIRKLRRIFRHLA